MKKKNWYIIVNAHNSFLYGSFPRTKDGKTAAVAYKDELKKKNKSLKLVIK